MPKQKYSKEEKAEYKAQKQAEIKEMVSKIEDGVKSVFSSDRYRDYLRFCSKFTNYSVNNTLLILSQRPDASLIAGFNKWKELGRSVNKGEKGIAILVPMKSKTNQYIETEVPDVDEYGNKQFNPDGTEKTKNIGVPVEEIRFRKGYVFDVSQTDGKEIPSLVNELRGDIDREKMNAIFSGVKKAVGIPVEFEDIKSGSKGYFSPMENRIVINNGMSDVQTLKTLFHEAAHAKLHSADSELREKLTRNDREIQAESTAFIIADHYGIDTSEYSFPYIASWSEGKELKTLKSYLDDIHRATKEICNSIDNELIKLKARDMSFGQLSESKELTNVQKAEILLERKERQGITFSETEKNEVYKLASGTDDIKPVAQKIREIENKQREISNYGNDFASITPTDSRQQAYEAYDRGEEVYMAYPDNTTEPVEERYEIEVHDGYYGVPDEPVPPPDYPEEYYSVNEPPTEEVQDGYYGVPDEPVPPPDYPEEYYSANEPPTENVEPSKPETKNFRVNNSIAEKVREQLNTDGVNFTAKENRKTTTFTVSTEDIDAYKNAVTKVKTEEKENQKIESLSAEHHIENTPKENIVDTKNFKVSNHAVDIIANQLKNDGIPFSAEKREIFTLFTISGQDENRFRESVERALPTVSRPSPDKTDHSEIPLYQESYNYAKNNNELTQFYNSLNAVKACDKFISENIEQELMNRNDKAFADEIENRFGLEKAMYVLSKALADRGKPVPGDNFSYNVKSFRPMINVSERMTMALYNELSQRAITQNKNKTAVQEQSLPAYFNGKHLYSVEKTALSSDGRGLPITQSISSAVNETFVKGYGWLDREQYNKAKSEYPNPREFKNLVEKYNVNYVTDDGRIGRADITPEELRTFNARTNSPENRERFETAKSKIKSSESEKPEMYFAISHVKGEKYRIETIGADGTKDAVVNNLSKQQAVQAMKEIYEEKRQTADVHIITPEELGNISVEIFMNQTAEERNPDKLFKVMENPNKEAAESLSHYVQEYRLDGEKYVPVGIAKVGTYEECAKIAEKLMKDSNPTYRIFQIRGGAEGREVRFEDIASLEKRGLKPDFRNYEQVYEAPLTDVTSVSDSLPEQLEYLFQKFNTDVPDGYTGRSMSISDVIILDKTPYFVDRVGFRGMRNFTPEQKLETALKGLESPQKTEIPSEKEIGQSKKSKTMKI